MHCSETNFVSIDENTVLRLNSFKVSIILCIQLYSGKLYTKSLARICIIEKYIFAKSI